MLTKTPLIVFFYIFLGHLVYIVMIDSKKKKKKKIHTFLCRENKKIRGRDDSVIFHMVFMYSFKRYFCLNTI